MIAALLLSQLAWAGDAGDIDLGAYLGAHFSGPNHELYEATKAPFRKLTVGGVLGLRGSYRPLQILAAEVEAHGGVAGTDGGSAAFLYTWRGHVVGYLPVKFPGGFEPFVLAGVGNLGVSSSRTTAVGNDIDAAFHMGLGASLPITEQLSLRADVRYLLTGKHGISPTPGGHTEVLLGLSFKIPGKADRDYDGIIDSKDDCPTQSETENGYLDDDGCPDSLAQVRLSVVDQENQPVAGVEVVVNDIRRGTTDAEGRLTVTGLLPHSHVAIQGTHAHMSDSAVRELDLTDDDHVANLLMTWLPGRVRVVTTDDSGPITTAQASFIGPESIDPGPVQDGDHIFFLSPGHWTVLVGGLSYGTERRDLDIEADEVSTVVIKLALQPAKLEVQREEVKILEKVHFETDSAAIDSTSFALLTEVANTLLHHPEIKKLEIQGHTDDRGSDAHNHNLSQDRVDSVLRFLVDKGVDADRLTARGFGESVPIADNTTEEGRALNRRVQFVILEQDGG